MLVERAPMGIAYLYEQVFAPAAGALLLSLSLGGCATAGSSLMDAQAQATPPKTSIYDQPPKPEKPAMTLDERQKMSKELNAARDRQAPNAKVKPPKVQPAHRAKP
jgi:hypothetical protein